jgi:REP element-mobilizing transposase RayT
MQGKKIKDKNPLRCRGLKSRRSDDPKTRTTSHRGGDQKTAHYKECCMARMIAFMATWTTYGTWLQGKKQGYVKDGITLDAKPELEKLNKALLKNDSVKLTKSIRPIVENAILHEAQKIGHKVYAVAVCSNHIHILLSTIGKNPGYSVGRLKIAGTKALKEYGFDGRIWTKGFYTGYCYNEKGLQQKIDYIGKHKE